MPRHMLSVLCRSVALDPFTNLLSIAEVAEELTVTLAEPLPNGLGPHTLPVVQAATPAVFVTLVQRSDRTVPEELMTRVTLVMPDGGELGGQELPMDLKSAQTARNLAQVSAIPYKGDGLYKLRFQVRNNANAWETLGEYPLNIVAAVAAPKAAE
jgi:hypothetical protein